MSLVFFLSLPGKASDLKNRTVLDDLTINTQDTLTTYPVCVKFLSVCCGVPSDYPLRQRIRAFKQKYKIKKLNAIRIGPLGREGEYDLAFELKGLSPARKKDFINRVKKAAIQMKEKGKAVVELNVKYDRSALPERLSIEKVEF
jgi:hypothetical protein